MDDNNIIMDNNNMDINIISLYEAKWNILQISRVMFYLLTVPFYLPPTTIPVGSDSKSDSPWTLPSTAADSHSPHKRNRFIQFPKTRN